MKYEYEYQDDDKLVPVQAPAPYRHTLTYHESLMNHVFVLMVFSTFLLSTTYGYVVITRSSHCLRFVVDNFFLRGTRTTRIFELIIYDARTGTRTGVGGVDGGYHHRR
eukprot:scaffold105614_cov31-Prasinocladus_malaysianus.AAC.1